MKKFLILICIVALFVIPIFLKKDPSADKVDCVMKLTVNGTEMELEDYVIGVVAAEMPASYELEALKAQAIAARTYAMYKLQNGQKELEASVKHQVFYSQKEREKKWQASYANHEQKVQKAVKETVGEIITYNSKPISAMFHAASNGQTESAKNYSGNDIAYLQSVPSPEKEEVTQQLPLEPWSQSDVKNMEIIRNETGRVQQVNLPNQQLTGREVRELFQLRSTDFTLEVKGGQLVATTQGYGHGVGMSQQGANQFALKGKEAEEILLHYYTGTEVEKLSCEKVNLND